ncbi:MAG: YcxB family protein [Bacteroidota bacterium]
MTITFNQTQEDISHLQKFFMSNGIKSFFGTAIRKILLGLFSLFLLGILIWQFAQIIGDWTNLSPPSLKGYLLPFLAHPIPLACLVVGSIVMRRLSYRRLSKLAIKKNPLLIGQREITFGEETMTVSTPNGTEEFPYSSIIYWTHSDFHEYIMIGDNVAISIPLRAFDDPQYEQYLNLKEKYGQMT